MLIGIIYQIMNGIDNTKHGAWCIVVYESLVICYQVVWVSRYSADKPVWLIHSHSQTSLHTLTMYSRHLHRIKAVEKLIILGHILTNIRKNVLTRILIVLPIRNLR
jgi:hypothetical protein